MKEIDENAGGENDAGGEENEKEMQVTAAETNAGNRRAGAGALQVLCFRKHFKFPFWGSLLFGPAPNMKQSNPILDPVFSGKPNIGSACTFFVGTFKSIFKF